MDVNMLVFDRTPTKFMCDIRPRSEKALGLIMMSEAVV